jgi:alcohol dehydrogenase class IV
MPIIEFPYWPKKIIAGIGTVEKIPNEILKLSGKRVIFFTDPNLNALPSTQNIVRSISDAGLAIDVYSEIEENPAVTSVHAAVKHMSEFKPDITVYFGGGSVIDLGKAANLIYTHGGIINEYEDLVGGIEKISNRLLPSIAIATTAGSGSEVSSVSVITDIKEERKIGIMSPYIVPDVSILDATVTVSMPNTLTAYTGMDALTHSIEAYTSNVPFEPGRGIALQGIKLVNRSLRKAVLNGEDILARQDMLVASACGAMAFNNNFLGTVHACAHQLTTLAGIPHGLANSIMLVPIMKWNLMSNIEAFADIAQMFGFPIHTVSPREAAEKAIDLVSQLATDLDIPIHLSKLGVTQDMIDKLVDKAYQDHNNLSNPRKSSNKDVLRQFYLEVF